VNKKSSPLLKNDIWHGADELGQKLVGSFFVREISSDPGLPLITSGQGCQIFLGTKYQNGKKYTKLPQNIPNVNKI
jgi:hypothetical protein